MITTPVQEQYIFDHNGVRIGVLINYPQNEISLVNSDGNPQQWVFQKRGLEYTKGWQNILSAMKEAIDDASNRLAVYKEEQTKKLALIYADGLEDINAKKDPTTAYRSVSAKDDAEPTDKN